MMTDRRQALAEATGLSVDALHDLKESVVNALVRKGVLVTIHIGRWRARHRLAPEDVGLDEQAAKALANTLDLGYKILLPRSTLQELARVESAGRANLERHSLDSRLGAFISDETLPKFLKRHEGLRTDYLGIRDSIIAEMPALRAQAAERFEGAAREIYQRLHPDVSQSGFSATYVERALKDWPSAAEVSASFYFDARIALVPLASELAREQAKLAEIREDEQVKAELRRQFAEERSRQIDGFLSDVVGSLRSMVYRSVRAALDNLEQHGTPSPRTTGSLRRLVEKVRALNVYGDTEINAQMVRLEQALVPAKRRTAVTTASLRAALVELSETTEAAVKDAFSVEPLLRRFALIDLSDNPAAAPDGAGAAQSALAV